MSYSFSIKSASKSDLIAAARAELAKVAEQQPIRDHDIATAAEAVENVFALVDEPAEGLAISLNMSGSLYTIDGAPKGASLSIRINPVRV